jgi:hypothetical protein
MHVWGYQLKLGLPGDSDGMLVGCTSLVVEDLEINCKTAGCQTGHDGIVGGNAMLVAPGLEGLLEDEIAIGMIGNHDVLVSQPGPDWETSCIIRVELADGDDMDVDLVRRGCRDDGW